MSSFRLIDNTAMIVQYCCCCRPLNEVHECTIFILYQYYSSNRIPPSTLLLKVFILSNVKPLLPFPMVVWYGIVWYGIVFIIYLFDFHCEQEGSQSSTASETNRGSGNPWFSRYGTTSCPTTPATGPSPGKITARRDGDNDGGGAPIIVQAPLMEVLENKCPEPMSLRSMLRFARKNVRAQTDRQTCSTTIRLFTAAAAAALRANRQQCSLDLVLALTRG